MLAALIARANAHSGAVAYWPNSAYTLPGLLQEEGYFALRILVVVLCKKDRKPEQVLCLQAGFWDLALDLLRWQAPWD